MKYQARLDVRGKNVMTSLQQAEQLDKGGIVNLINQHLKMAWPYLQMSRR